MKVESAEFVLAPGTKYPLLRVVVDGREAFLHPTERAALTSAGLVHLDGPGWEKTLPPVRYRTEDGARIELRGFAKDPVLWWLQLRLDEETRRGPVEPGPVDVPTPEAARRLYRGD